MGPNGCVLLLFLMVNNKLLLADVVNTSLSPAAVEKKWEDLELPTAPILDDFANRSVFFFI